jgi:transcriptional regulator with XRE-family HTH domain
MKRTVSTQEELGTRLADARKAAGVTQAELASQVGLDRTALVKIENGSRRVDSLELSRIAVALKRPIDWFLVPPPRLVASRRAAQVSIEPDADLQLELLARDVEQLVELGAVRLPETARSPGAVKNVAQAERAAAAARRRGSE